MVCPSVSLTTRNFNETEDWEGVWKAAVLKKKVLAGILK